MRRLIACILALPAACFATTATDVSNAVEAHMGESNMFTGQDLFELRARREFFIGYVAGVADTGSLTGPPQRRYCVPDGVKNTQMADVVYKFLTENPAGRHLGAAHLVRMSFRDAWPCHSAPAAAPARRVPSL